MSKLRYRTRLEFDVSGWIDQTEVVYGPKHGGSTEHQEEPGFKLFGYTVDNVLVECGCVLEEGRSGEGIVHFDSDGKEELFYTFLPLPEARFNWLHATLARCQDHLSQIEVFVMLDEVEAPDDASSISVTILGASFALIVGDYFAEGGRISSGR